MPDPNRLEYQRRVRARAAELKAVAAAMGVTAGEFVEDIRAQERLRRQRHGSRSTERGSGRGNDREVGMQPEPLDRPDAER